MEACGGVSRRQPLGHDWTLGAPPTQSPSELPSLEQVRLVSPANSPQPAAPRCRPCPRRPRAPALLPAPPLDPELEEPPEPELPLPDPLLVELPTPPLLELAAPPLLEPEEPPPLEP